MLTDNSAFLRVFEVGIEKEGYWNSDHMALQFEDLVDCLKVSFPSIDFLCLFDQSSGHGKKRENGLSVVDMNTGWGGKQSKMRNTGITEGCLGPYQRTLEIGDVQSMVFQESEEGPFDMSPAELLARRYDVVLEEINRAKTKEELDAELRALGFLYDNKRYNKKELVMLATLKDVHYHCEQDL
jgi:hypothetical protein